jgi:CubicO group peptidase (beta-lactamase class C family)
MRSAGKTVTGLLVGIAIDNGLIDGVNMKAASFFDDIRPFENSDQRKEDITLEDLLTMSGPLECDDWNSFSRGNEERMYLVEDWSAFFFNLPIKNRPSWEIPDDDGGFGRTFTYCTAGAQLLGEIVERAADETAAEYAARQLFGPIGINNPKWNYASSGKAHLGGGLELTTADWARVARLYVNRGRVGTEQIVSESWLNASMADHVQIDKTTNYGYLWWRPHYEVGGITYAANAMSGSGGNRVYVLPEFQVAVVLTKSDFRDGGAHEKSDHLFANEIAARLRR